MGLGVEGLAKGLTRLYGSPRASNAPSHLLVALSPAIPQSPSRFASTPPRLPCRRPWFKQEVVTIYTMHSQGMSNREIASRLGRDVGSVARHLEQSPADEHRNSVKILRQCLGCGFDFISESRLIFRCAACIKSEMNRGVDLG